MSLTNVALLADPEDLALRVGKSATDPKLLQALRAASADFVAAVYHPVVLVVDDVVYLSGRGTDTLRLPAAPVVGPLTVKVDGVEVTDYQVGRLTGLLRRASCWPSGLDNVEVTYSHGYASIPAGIQTAVLDMAEYRMSAAVGIDSVTTAGESVRFTQAGGTTAHWNATVNRYMLGEGDSP